MENKIKILIITQGFYPEQSPRSFRASELAKEFSRQGHMVTVMAPYRETTENFAKQYGFIFNSLGVLTWNIFNFKSLGIFGKVYNKFVNRFLNLFFEYPMMEIFFKTRKAIKEEKKQYDLLISIAVPHPIHWAVASVWNLNKNNLAKVWIADCGDAYMGNDLDRFRKPFYFMFLEKWFCRKADYITIPKEEMKINFYKEFHSKFREIPQGFNFKDSLKYLKPYVKNKVPTFAFSGSFIPGNRDPYKLLAFLTSLDIDFRFHIFTMTKSHVLPFIDKSKGKIILHDYIPRNELLGVLSQMDFLINITFEPQKQIPSKLIDYLLTDRPILNIDKDLDEENILKFLSYDYSDRFNKLSLERYRIESVCEQFIKLSNNVLVN